MGHIAGIAATGISGALGLFWFIAILYPYGWQQTNVVGVYFYVGLYRVETTNAIVSLVPSFGIDKVEKVKEAIKQVTSVTTTVQSMRNSWCSMPGFPDALKDGACDIWGWMFVGGMIMLVLGLIAVIFFVLGAGFSYFYWQNPRAEPRMWARVAFIIAPSTACFALLLYTCLTWGFGDWDPTYLRTEHAAFSAVFMLCWTLAVLSWIPLVLHEVFAGKAWIEEHNEAASEYRHEQREAAMDGAYGGGYNYGATGPPMGGPPMQQQGWGGGYGYQGN